MTETKKPLIAVIATGGTIASQRGADGASTPSLKGASLLKLVPAVAIELRVMELMAKDSSSLTLADMQAVSDAVAEQLADDAIASVVILHGTDSMEETSLLVQVQNRLTKPVVFTGAQRTADHPEADGPANLAASLEAACNIDNAARGVLVCFGGRTLPVWGLYKFSADATDAFRQSRQSEMIERLTLTGRVGGLRVDVVAVYPGCDGVQIDASVAAGANGIVLAALGSGNATAEVVQAVARCHARRIPVIVSSRVPDGRLAAAYGGGGGGHDLGLAGAIHATTLRPGQARILLAALIASQADRETIAAAFSHD